MAGGDPHTLRQPLGDTVPAMGEPARRRAVPHRVEPRHRRLHSTLLVRGWHELAPPAGVATSCREGAGERARWDEQYTFKLKDRQCRSSSLLSQPLTGRAAAASSQPSPCNTDARQDSDATGRRPAAAGLQVGAAWQGRLERHLWSQHCPRSLCVLTLAGREDAGTLTRT